MIVLSQKELGRVKHIKERREKLNNRYLSDFSNNQTRFLYDQFFDFSKFVKGDSEKVLMHRHRAELLNMSLCVPYTVSSLIADYVGIPITSYNQDMEETLMSYTWAGYSVMLVSSDDRVHIEHVEPEHYVYRDTPSGGEHVLLSFYEQEEKHFILLSTYKKEGTVVLRRELFEIIEVTSQEELQGNPVPLSACSFTRGLEPEVELGLSHIPVVVVHNTKLHIDDMGSSPIDLVLPLISNLEIQLVNIQDQFLKHLQSKLALPISALIPDPKTGKINVKDLEVFGVDVGEEFPRYIMNQNPMMNQAFTNIENLLKSICAVMKIPSDFMPVTVGSVAESSETKEIRRGNFVKMIQKIRRKFSIAFDTINLIAEELGSTDNHVPVWEEIFPKDKHKHALELQIGVTSGFVSPLTAVMQYQEIDEEDALIELERIKEYQSVGSEQVRSPMDPTNNLQ